MKPARIPDTHIPPQHWGELPWGEYYRDALEEQLRPWLSKIFGFHLLKIGNLSAEINTQACLIPHQINVAPQGVQLHIKADPLHLPFAEKSVDACLLAHILPWCTDPHSLLREADRVLVDDGWLMLSSFNPISLIGLAKTIPFLRKRMPYNGRMFTPVRLFDWLALLNFEVVQQSSFQVLPWRSQGGKLLNTHLPVLGCMHILVARKRTFPLTLNPLKARATKRQIHSAVGATRHY